MCKWSGWGLGCRWLTIIVLKLIVDYDRQDNIIGHSETLSILPVSTKNMHNGNDS
jgi:hypothetical protein